MSLFSLSRYRLRPAAAARGEAGFSLLEATLTLGILSAIIAATWLVMGRAVDENRQQTLNKQVLTTVENIRSYLRTVDLGGTTLTNTQLDNLRLLPDGLRRVGTTARWNHAYNGNFIVNVSNFGPGRSDAISIELRSLPSDVCIKLIYGNLVGGQQAANMGFAGYATTQSYPTTGYNATLGAISTACAGNNIWLYFTL